MTPGAVLSLCAVVFIVLLLALVLAGEAARDLHHRWQARGRRSTADTSVSIGFRVTDEHRVGHVRVIDEAEIDTAGPLQYPPPREWYLPADRGGGLR